VIIRPRTWAVKPPPGAAINRNHPLAFGLVHAVVFGERAGKSTRNLARPSTPATLITKGGTYTEPSWGMGPRGPRLYFQGTDTMVDLGVQLGFTTNDMTFAVLAHRKGQTGNTANGLVFQRPTATGLNQQISDANVLGYHWNDEFNTYSFSGGPTIPLDSLFLAAGAHRSDQMLLWLNGAQVIHSNGTSATAFTTNSAFAVGSSDPSTFDRTFNGDIYAAWVWNRTLTPTELWALYVNPWAMFVAPDLPPAKTTSGGTLFTQSLTGSITPTGSILKQTRTTRTGTFTPAGSLLKMMITTRTGALTPAGTVVKQTNKPTSGALTPAATVRALCQKVLAGAFTPAGALIKQTNKPLAATNTPSGSLLKKTLKTFTGALTPVGLLTAVKTILVALAGALTPSGSLINKTLTTKTGAITPAGSLVKMTLKTLTGALTPTGALVAIKAFFVALTAALTPSGTLVKQTRTTLTAANTPSGLLVKKTIKAFAGSVASAGVLGTVKVVLLSLVAALTPTGTLVRRVNKSVTASLTPASGLVNRTARSLAAALAPGGVLAKTTQKSFTATVPSTGTLAKRTMKSLAASLTPTGTLGKLIRKTLTAVISPVASLLGFIPGRQADRAVTVTVTAESRIVVVAAIDSTVTVRAQSRTVIVPLED
jgi:hypothetical protein